MSDSVSWVGLGLSALLIIDKFLTKNRLKKCKCCGACFEFEGVPETPKPHHHTTDEITIEIPRRKTSDRTKSTDEGGIEPQEQV